MRRNKVLDPAISEARAGLISASDDLQEEIQARHIQTTRVINALKLFAVSGHHRPDDVVVRETLVHLRRYCDWKGLPFETLNATAHEQYLDEMSLNQ